MAAAGLAVDTVTIPTSCAECFGAYWQCGIQACEENCASDTEECVDCVQGACDPIALTCLGCGDGECGAAENSSSCPED